MNLACLTIGFQFSVISERQRKIIMRIRQVWDRKRDIRYVTLNELVWVSCDELQIYSCRYDGVGLILDK